MPKENIDEYVEAIYDIGGGKGAAKTGDLAERLKVAPASVTEALQRMAKRGLVAYEPYKGVSLTVKGLEMAKRLKRKHRLLEVFLSKYLGLKGDSVHEEACKMEHVISDETEAALCKMMGNPAECPDGEPIPSCGLGSDSCGACVAGAVPLTSLKVGQKARIAHIHGGKSVCRKLTEMGLTPGTEVSLVRAAPLHGPAEVRVRGSCLAIGSGIAAKIFVRPGA
jgi:DtxR family Mn-dependent transcriptional regulator